MQRRRAACLSFLLGFACSADDPMSTGNGEATSAGSGGTGATDPGTSTASGGSAGTSADSDSNSDGFESDGSEGSSDGTDTGGPVDPPETMWFGIPDPPFCIDEQAPSEADACPGWPSAESPNCYYVDNNAACDDGADLGSPNNPRCSIWEGTYSAGAYVLIAGQQSGGGQIITTINGTADEPVWFRGASAEERPTITGQWLLKGEGNVYLENMAFETGKIGVRPHNGDAPANDVCIRRNTFMGAGTDEGNSSVIALAGLSPAQRGHHIVVYDNEIAEYGDDNPQAGENDYHGVAPNSNMDDIWVLDNHIHNMGGDSVQVGYAEGGDDSRPSRVYISGNHFHDDHENAVDIKKSTDVIVSNNRLHGYVPTSSSGGAVVVVHNTPERVWILNNFVYDGALGLISTGGRDVHFVGNVVYNNSQDALHFRGNTSGSILHNTVADSAQGLNLQSVDAGVQVFNNTFSNTGVGSFDVRYNSSQQAGAVEQDYNLFSADDGFSGLCSQASMGANTTDELQSGWGCPAQTPKETQGQVGAIDFVDGPGADFHVSASSAAMNSGSPQEFTAYVDFEALYGLRIDRDIDGAIRGSTDAPDVGAYETQ